MKSQQTLTYFKATMPPAKMILFLQSIEELIRYITLNHVHTLFLLHEGDSDHEYFGCLQQGVVVAHDSLGFKTIEEYKESRRAGFPDATLFYAAKQEGYSSYKDYQLVKEAGIADIQIFEKVKDGGYITGYQDWEEWRKTKQELPGWGKITDPYNLYQYGIAGDFADYQHLKTALSLGFTNASHYAAAIEKGYQQAADYEDGLKRGFLQGKAYYFALNNHIRDVADLNRFFELNNIESRCPANDQRLLISVISKLPQDKKVSINKLNDLLKEELNAYLYEDTREMPGWFTKSLQNAADIGNFLQTTDYARQFGTYDNEGEYFETKHLNERKVVLDGANVAHGAVGNDKSKPTVSNIIKVISKLKSKGFTEITVISDASLRHRLTDKERLTDLEGNCEYLTAPAETTADLFLIDFVKKSGCLLVTNDTFREWKLKDKWVAENIDYYKLAFMIDGDKVLMPDLDTNGG